MNAGADARQTALGLDFGRVIMCAPEGVQGGDTRFIGSPEVEALEIPPPAGAFDTIRELVQRFESRVWIVSTAGPRIQRLSMGWLEYHRFFEQTELTHEAVRFCRHRNDKRGHAAELRLTHFIDDRYDVLDHLSGVVGNRYLFGVQHQIPRWAIHVRDWAAVRAALLAPP
jgi:hypothetical protein